LAVSIITDRDERLDAGIAAEAAADCFAATNDAPEYLGDKPVALAAECSAQVGLVACIFGNPFRPITADAAWLTPTAVSLAQAIYDDRAFDRLPILADALEDAGCDNADLLNHCRLPGEHVRGCWPVDLLSGKQ
jgi:hypothetical protein